MVATFSLVYLFQTIDKTCKRKKFFDKIKIPLLSCCLMGLLISCDDIDDLGSSGPFFSFDPFGQSKLVSKQAAFTDLGNF